MKLDAISLDGVHDECFSWKTIAYGTTAWAPDLPAHGVGTVPPPGHMRDTP